MCLFSIYDISQKYSELVLFWVFAHVLRPLGGFQDRNASFKPPCWGIISRLANVSHTFSKESSHVLPWSSTCSFVAWPTWWQAQHHHHRGCSFAFDAWPLQHHFQLDLKDPDRKQTSSLDLFCGINMASLNVTIWIYSMSNQAFVQLRNHNTHVHVQERTH